MATDIKAVTDTTTPPDPVTVQIKRYTSSGWVSINPKTIGANVSITPYYNGPIDKKDPTVNRINDVNSAITDLAAHRNTTGNPHGTKIKELTDLSGDGKIPERFLPNSVFSGLTFHGSFSYFEIDTFLNIFDGGTQGLENNDKMSLCGYYQIADQDGIFVVDKSDKTSFKANDVVTFVLPNGGKSIFTKTADSWTVSAGDAICQKGDWVLFQGKKPLSGGQNISLTFVIVNNSFEDATTDRKGVVQLADIVKSGTTKGHLTDGALTTDTLQSHGFIKSISAADNVLTWVDQTYASHTFNNDTYTGHDGTTIKVDISANNVISSEVKDKAITSGKLADAINTNITQGVSAYTAVSNATTGLSSRALDNAVVHKGTSTAPSEENIYGTKTFYNAIKLNLGEYNSLTDPDGIQLSTCVGNRVKQYVKLKLNSLEYLPDIAFPNQKTSILYTEIDRAVNQTRILQRVYVDDAILIDTEENPTLGTIAFVGE